MSHIIATKSVPGGKDLQKRFSEESWRMMGKDKNGWSKLTDSVATNNAVKKSVPETGEKAVATKQTASNTVTDEKIDSVATNKVENESAAVKATPTVEASEVENEFFGLVVANGITKSTLKNELDEKNESYKSSDSLEVLSGLVIKSYNGDIAALKEKFGI